MKRKPWPIVLLAILHFFSPLGNVLANAYHYNVPLQDFVQALFYPGNWPHLLALVVLPIVGGVCIYVCRKWSYALYILLMTVPFGYSIYSAKGFFPIRNILFLLSLYLVNIIIVGYFLIPNIRNIYFNPRLRWWQTKPRFVTDFAASIEQGTAAPILGYVKNISAGGFFIETPGEFAIESPLIVHFNFNNVDYQITATPVFQRTAEPPGYGFKVDPKDAKKAKLRKVVNQIKAQGALVLGRAPGPEDYFTTWLRHALRSKQAWIPQAKH